ncbi:MAG: hypothetical protein HKP30_12315, partial [Myxococcales bacterium]|nr:hypothetical protein [Myxococcales bacterium]
MSTPERSAAGSPKATGSPEATGSPKAAALLAALWAVALALLAGAWIQSPFTGPGPMFGLWSAVAIPLALWSLGRPRAWGLGALPGGVPLLLAVAIAWLAAAWAATSPLPAEWAIDGLILRNDGMRRAGIALAWLPGVFGLALSVV